MERIILRSSTRHDTIDAFLENDEPTKRLGVDSPFSTSLETTLSWGRQSHHGSWLYAIGSACVMILSPLLVIFYWIAFSSYEASLISAFSGTFLRSHAGDKLQSLFY